jgi:hypothetical protein
VCVLYAPLLLSPLLLYPLLLLFAVVVFFLCFVDLADNNDPFFSSPTQQAETYLLFLFAQVTEAENKGILGEMGLTEAILKTKRREQVIF